MTNLLNFGVTAEQPLNAIHKAYNMGDLGDEPNSYRWRATWHREYDGTITGIDLTAYPVLRKTPQGAQIDPHAWRQLQRDGLEWTLSGQKRFVTDTGDAAWAKPTQERALHSLAVRLDRWARNVRNDVIAVRNAAHVLKVLRPDDAWLGQEARYRLTEGDFWTDERIAEENEHSLIGLVMKLTGGSANPEVVRGQIQNARERAAK